MRLRPDDPLAGALIEAIRAGDVGSLRGLLAEHRGLASARIEGAARLLVARGARVDRLWQAAALGMTSSVERLLAAVPSPSRQDIDDAFWQACHGGQRRMAEYLLSLGADLNATPSWSALRRSMRRPAWRTNVSCWSAGSATAAPRPPPARAEPVGGRSAGGLEVDSCHARP
jgi:ankyrin repeat protein